MTEPLDFPLAIAREQLAGIEVGLLDWRSIGATGTVSPPVTNGHPCTSHSIGHIGGSALNPIAALVERLPKALVIVAVSHPHLPAIPLVGAQRRR